MYRPTKTTTTTTTTTTITIIAIAITTTFTIIIIVSTITLTFTITIIETRPLHGLRHPPREPALRAAAHDRVAARKQVFFHVCMYTCMYITCILNNICTVFRSNASYVCLFRFFNIFLVANHVNIHAHRQKALRPRRGLHDLRAGEPEAGPAALALRLRAERLAADYYCH